MYRQLQRYWDNRDAILNEARKKYAALSKEEKQSRIDYARDYQQRNRRKYLSQRRNRHAAFERCWRDSVPERYVREILSGYKTHVRKTEWPKDLVSAKQQQLKIKRLCRKLNQIEN